jgi:hypothetical protein
MRALQMTVNGKHVCLAGLPAERLIFVAINYMGESSVPGASGLIAGVGLCGREGDELLTWPNCQLNAHDEISLRLVESEDAEQPPTRQAIRT